MRSSFLQSPQVLVVEASAGSGKTYELSRRYVQLCLYLAQGKNSLPIQSILCVTFTNKAAWEMKWRILGFLKRIALKQLNPLEVQDILKPLGLDESQASPLGSRLMNDIIRQYHYFQVQTIDSFINILLVGCSFKIGLSARFKIQRNSKEYLQRGLDELLEEAHHDERLRGLFESFLRQYLFFENRSKWFPKEDLLAIIYELFRQYNTYQKPLVVYPAEDDLFARKRKIHGLIEELKNLCPPETNKRFRDYLQDLHLEAGGAFDVDELKSLAREDFPINKGGIVSPALEDLWCRLRSEIQGLCWLEAHSLFNLHVLLFKELLRCFNRLSQKDDVLFLEELNRRASVLFDDHLVTVEELYFRLASRFRHYLVDEFQDTSLAQWRNLAPLVQEGLASGGSLFYVGDKKQAIYAFRGGESRLFDALQSQLQDFNVQIKTLDKNYRSLPLIIDFNNKVFSLENLRGFLDRREADAKEHGRKEIHFSENDFGVMAQTFTSNHQQAVKSQASGLVRVTHLQDGVKQQVMQEVRSLLIPLVNDLRTRFALKDIAILTRGNEEVETITQWLMEERILVKSERSSDIKKHPLIAELVHLLNFLSSPVDNNAFAQFCLGEVMPQATGLSPEVLRDFLFESARILQNRQLYLYQHFREVFPKVWADFFEEFLRQMGIYPLYELTAQVMERFRCIQNFPGFQGFFMHFLELVKSQESNSCAVSYFLNYYENLEGEGRFVPMAQVNAVEVLTVHKAKGLEFPVVIVPFLEMDVKASNTPNNGGGSYLLDIQEEGMGLIRLKESYRQFCAPLQERYEKEYRKAFLIELNSVYVALTRAIEELYVFIPSKAGNTVNPAKFLVPSDSLSLGAPAPREKSMKETGHQQTHRKIKPFKLSSWEGLREEFLNKPEKSFVWARQGEFYHALLKDIEFGATHRNPNLQEGGNLADIHVFINRADVRRFFYLPPEALVFCEKEFVNAFGDTKRIDRLIVLKDEVWVVDFKWSSIDGAEHQKQMEGYIELIKQFYPKHKVTGHILYLHNAEP